GNVADAGRQSLENRVKMLDGLPGPANHHAVAALQAPDAAAGANINVVDAAFFQFLRTPHVVLEVGIAAVNDDVAGFELLSQRHYSLFGGTSGGNHDPGSARLFQFGNKIIQGRGADGAFLAQFLHVLRAEV